MNSETTGGGAAAAREQPPEAEKTARLIAETANLLSAHTSVVHAAVLRLLALEARLAALHGGGAATREPAVAVPPAWRGALPSEPGSPILSAAPTLRLMAIHSVEGNATLLEICLVATLAKRADARAVFEFGTFDGRTTLNLAANIGPEGKVFTLERTQSDAPTKSHRGRTHVEKHAGGFRYKGTPFEASITQLYGDSATFDFGRFLDAMDFVFIGASHSYEGVLNDSRIALRLLRNGRGTVAWHGYAPAFDRVVRALEKLYASEPEFAAMRHIAGTDLAYARVSCEEGGNQCG